MDDDFGRLTNWTSIPRLTTMGWSRRKMRAQNKYFFCAKRSPCTVESIGAAYIEYTGNWSTLHTVVAVISTLAVFWQCITVLLLPLVVGLNITEHFSGRSSSFGSFLVNYVYLGYMVTVLVHNPLLICFYFLLCWDNSLSLMPSIYSRSSMTSWTLAGCTVVFPKLKVSMAGWIRLWQTFLMCCEPTSVHTYGIYSFRLLSTSCVPHILFNSGIYKPLSHTNAVHWGWSLRARSTQGFVLQSQKEELVKPRLGGPLQILMIQFTTWMHEILSFSPILFSQPESRLIPPLNS